MTHIENEDLERNWLWLATDRAGFLGVFQTFGDGALPDSICSSLEDAEIIDEFICTTLQNGPAICLGQIRKESEALTSFSRFPREKYQKDYSIYLAGVEGLASRGLFVYDANLQSNRPVGYFQIGHPSSPRTLDSLPERIQHIVQRTLFDLDFANVTYLSVEMVKNVSCK